ncbi:MULTISPECIES: aminoglycoside N(3)-acetyltransferase [unclassified Exiguobacterium]|jgi:aminoglycoside 3-N-acetyltransferase|uniref:aminoglycoside N(3)-acetyltransferase n=1 Tax=unclassified Exiguobacterium TaxID=2644629 RepID=UPI001BEC35B5|nr:MULTISPECIES: AAC(3) family N-acetyltransferase [unclassified Exiguobacterium]
MKHIETKTSLVAHLQGAGVKPGDTLFVHTSLSKLGWVCGGAQTVIEALQDTVGPDGLIMMATQSSDNSDPAEWEAPPVPVEWWPTIREEMPAYDQEKTPTRGMGRVPELFRTYPNVFRSDHPMWSVAAWGNGAEEIVAGHTLEVGFGPGSPIERMIERNAKILHLGSPLDATTLWHYAEYGIDGPVKSFGCALYEDGARVWKTFDHTDVNSDPFGPIGENIVRRADVTTFQIEEATCYVIPSETWEPVQHALIALRSWLR